MRALFGMVLLCASAWGQEGEVLTLPQAVSMAVSQNRTVRTARIETQRVAERIAMERTHLFPSLSTWALGGQLLSRPSIRFDPGVLGTYPDTGPIPGTSTTISSGRTPVGIVLAQASLPLTQRIRIHLTIMGLHLEENLYRQVEREKRQGVTNDVKHSYYMLQQTESQLTSAEQSVTLFREALRLTEDNLKQQTVLAGDVLDVRARLARAELQTLQLRNGMDSLREQLNEYLGRDITTPFRTDPLPEEEGGITDVAEARRRALAGRPELAQARIRLEGATLDRRARKAEYLPNVSLAVDYFSTLHLTGVVPANVAAAGLQIQWEPFDWGRKKHEIAEKRQVEEQASLAVKEAESRILRDVGAQYRKLEEARRQLTVSRLGQQTAEENLRVMKNKYGLQAVLLKDLLQSEALFADAASQYRQSLAQFWTARADLGKGRGRGSVKGWLLVLTVSFVGCRSGAQAPEEKVPPAVHTGVVEVQQNRESTKYSADIVPATMLNLAFRVNGYVQSVLQVHGRIVQEGDSVTAETVLARVRTTDYTAKVAEARSQVADAQAGVAAAKAQLAEAQAGNLKADQDFARAQSLFASKSLTKPDLDAARAQRDAARARVQAASAQIESMQAKIGGAEGLQTEAESALGDTSLRAPISGVILARKVEEGQLIGAGMPAFVLADVRNVKVVVGVPDVSLSSFHLGAMLPVTVEAVPQGLFNGRITAISPAADPKGRVFSVELTIANPRGVLKPGMIASVAVIASNAPPVAAVPLSAVVEATQDAERYAVFVIQRQDGKTVARRQKVSLGEVKGNRIAVRAGLSAGQRIVVSGGSLLTDGQTVVEIP